MCNLHMLLQSNAELDHVQNKMLDHYLGVCN